MNTKTPVDPLSNPYGLMQKYHIDKDMNWCFDPSVSPQNFFQIQKIIGKGGFSVVAHVYSIATQRDFAGKIIDLSAIDTKAEETIQKEVAFLKLLKSPCIINYYGSVQWGDSKMLLLEYCDKGSFRQILDVKHDVLTENQISIVMRDLIRAVKVLHDKSIVHSDIKAANLLLNSKGEVKLCDFGVSEKIDPENENKGSKSIIGTPYWMAPEVISGEPYMFPADIWSIGITAVELAEGAPPLVEFPPTKAMIEISRNGFVGLRRPQDHSQLFTSFIINCLIKDPKSRLSISQLLLHPFVAHGETLDRKTEFANLMDVTLPEISFVNGAFPQKTSPPTSVSNTSSDVKLSSAKDLNMKSSSNQSFFGSGSLFSLPSTLSYFDSSYDSSLATPEPFVSSNPDYAKLCSSDFDLSNSGSASHNKSNQNLDPSKEVEGSKLVYQSDKAPAQSASMPVETPGPLNETFSQLRSKPETSSSLSEASAESDNTLVESPRARDNVYLRKSKKITHLSDRIDPLELQEKFKSFLKDDLEEKVPSSPNFRRDIDLFETSHSERSASIPDNDLSAHLDQMQPSQMPFDNFDIEASGKEPTKLESLFL